MSSFITGMTIASLLSFGLTQSLETGKDFSGVEPLKASATGGKRPPPGIVLLESSSRLIRDLNTFLEGDNAPRFVGDTILATFDHTGLGNQVLFSDSFEFFRAVKTLENQSLDRGYLPTFHVIHDLVQNHPIGSVVLVITKSKVSDDDFGNVLANTLVGRKVEVSVLWLGDRRRSEYEPLQDLTRLTGGKFEFLADKVKRLERLATESGQGNAESNFLESNVTNKFDRIKFQEITSPGDINSVLTMRASSEKYAGNFNFPVVVDVASGSSLEVRPGVPARIPFTVKNNLNSGVNVIFGAKYKSVPQFLQPDRAFLPPLATLNVYVNVKPNGNSQPNTNSTLTFSVFLGSKIITRSAIVSFVPLSTYDKTQPRVTYKYGGDCMEFQDLKTCDSNYWGVEISAQDEESGILKITSEPYGLLFQPEFIAGTKDPVTAYYSATCCHPKVDVWVEDLRGNYVKRSLDVLDQSLKEGEIAAIVLGVLLLVFSIIAVLVAVILIKRRNRRNMVLARPRTHSR